MIYNNLTQAEKDSLMEHRKKYGKARFYIHGAMHKIILPRVEASIITKEARDRLGTSYQGLDKVKTSKLQILRRDFESLSMKETKSINSFYTRVVGLINQLKSHGETIEDQRVVEKILRSIPPRIESFVVTLEESKDMSVFTIDELQDLLINCKHISHPS